MTLVLGHRQTDGRMGAPYCIVKNAQIVCVVLKCYDD